MSEELLLKYHMLIHKMIKCLLTGELELVPKRMPNFIEWYSALIDTHDKVCEHLE